MKTVTRRSRHRLQVVAPAPDDLKPRDELDVARARMRHLAPWHVEALPAMHAAHGTTAAPLTPLDRARGERLAARVLAVQIWNAGALGALEQ